MAWMLRWISKGRAISEVKKKNETFQLGNDEDILRIEFIYDSFCSAVFHGLFEKLPLRWVDARMVLGRIEHKEDP